jgi:diacylglycerol O-acyltransferase / wax synthase
MDVTTSQPGGRQTAASCNGVNGSSADHGRRLSAVDGSFLRLESPQSHMHVGFSAVFAAPSDGPRPSVEALRERAAGRLHEVPWCRWRLDDAPLGLSEPRWIDDADFDLAAHVLALTPPEDCVSYASFEALRSAVLSAPLDRSRPLWQIFLVPQLEDGRVGMVGKIHHALVDGLAALQIVSLILDSEPDVVSQPPASWQPRGRPGPLGWALDAVRQTLDDGVGVLRAGAHAITHPESTVESALRNAKRLVGAVAEDVLPPAPQSSLNATIGARRTLVGYHARRDELRAARRAGGTLNDVGLAAVAGALRELFLRDGEPAPAEPLKAMVPVSMRRLGDGDAGNQIAMVFIPLPVHLATPRARMDWVREQTELLKHTDRPAGTQTLYQAAGLLPTPLRSPVAKAMATSRQFNLTVSQSPAPRGSLYLLGCELEEVYSVVPIAQGHALAVGMVRYRQELFFGCYADPDALPEVYELPALLEAEVRTLGEAAAAVRSGGAARPAPGPRANAGAPFVSA